MYIELIVAAPWFLQPRAFSLFFPRRRFSPLHTVIQKFCVKHVATKWEPALLIKAKNKGSVKTDNCLVPFSSKTMFWINHIKQNYVLKNVFAWSLLKGQSPPLLYRPTWDVNLCHQVLKHPIKKTESIWNNTRLHQDSHQREHWSLANHLGFFFLVFLSSAWQAEAPTFPLMSHS